MKQTDIAKELGVSRSYISAVLKGKKKCNERIAEVLNKYYDLTWIEHTKVIKTYQVDKESD